MMTALQQSGPTGRHPTCFLLPLVFAKAVCWHPHFFNFYFDTAIHNSVIFSTLLYGLESTVLLEPHVHRLESFVIHCLRIILGVSVKEKKHHTTTRKMAKQLRISSIFYQRCLHFLGYLSRIPEDWLPRQLLVCAPVGGKNSAGG